MQFKNNHEKLQNLLILALLMMIIIVDKFAYDYRVRLKSDGEDLLGKFRRACVGMAAVTTTKGAS